MSDYWSQWDYSKVMEWAEEIDDEETDGDFEEDIFKINEDEDEYSMPISLDSLGMSWADFM